MISHQGLVAREERSQADLGIVSWLVAAVSPAIRAGGGRYYGASGEGISSEEPAMERPIMNDLSRSRKVLEQDSTLIAVVELSLSNWVVAGIVPGLDRHPMKKLGADHDALLQLVERWRDEAIKAWRTITRTVVAFEAGRDGFWLARWLKARGIEAFVIHSTSVAVPREHRRAKTDRLDTELLKRAFLGWLRGEPDHFHMAAIPTPDRKTPGDRTASART
jgi:hypothetical protein